MKVAVLSDIHDHIDNLRNVISKFSEHQVEHVIFCGDMVSPFTTGILAETNLPAHACLGNNDEDQIGMMKKGGSNFTWFHLSQEFGEAEIDGKKIAFCHYPKLAELLAKSKRYDAVFFGHTHNAIQENHGKTLLLNPGSVCGINFDSGSYDKTSFAVYDTATNTAEILTI